jgi:lysylphosphatidylglycerol synthetase-like protein (DUF2156 family)
MTDKRLLKQQYLDANSRAGVYAIRNLLTDRMLVAGSMDVQGALNRHRFELRQGGHRNRLLRQDWSQHGEAGFVFEVLDMLEPRDDAAFDLVHELKQLVDLWRLETACRGEKDYAFAGRTA